MRVDYYKLVVELTGDRYLVRPYFYTSVSIPPSPNQTRFHNALKYQGFTIVTRPLKTIDVKGQKINIEKGVDIALVTDMLVAAFRGQYETAILVSGDSDYALVVDEIKRLGKRVEVCSFRSAIGTALRAAADKFIALDDLVEKVKLER